MESRRACSIRHQLGSPDVRLTRLLYDIDEMSKGLSAPVTFIAGCVEGLLPKQPARSLPLDEQRAQLEEQRRLFYVGMTRVKAAPDEEIPGTLILTYSLEMPLATAMGAGISPSRTQYGTAHMIASRFIQELGLSSPTPVAV